MSYIKKFIKSSLIVIIMYILPIIITIITALIYNMFGYNSIDIFINNYLTYILIIYYLISIISLIIIYKPKLTPLNTKNYYTYISLGISISIILNMLIFKINKPIIDIKIPLYINIISSGLLGPIYEEIIFRYIYLNKLKKFNSNIKSITINTIVFAIIHLNPIKIFYALILGLILNIAYNKNNNILVPIIIHISSNLIAVFLTNYNNYLLVLSTVLLLLSTYINIKEK